MLRAEHYSMSPRLANAHQVGCNGLDLEVSKGSFGFGREVSVTTDMKGGDITQTLKSPGRFAAYYEHRNRIIS